MLTQDEIAEEERRAIAAEEEGVTHDDYDEPLSR